VQKLPAARVVRLNAAHLRGREKHDVRSLAPEERVDAALIAKIELRARTNQQ
jgi:hypothetical protein